MRNHGRDPCGVRTHDPEIVRQTPYPSYLFDLCTVKSYPHQILKDLKTILLIFQTHRQQIIAEYDEQIQKELSSIKAAYEKKELTERSIRQKLEKDMDYCRQNHGHLSVKGRKTDPKRDMNADIKKVLDEKEAKILQLEKELIQVS